MSHSPSFYLKRAIERLCETCKFEDSKPGDAEYPCPQCNVIDKDDRKWQPKEGERDGT